MALTSSIRTASARARRAVLYLVRPVVASIARLSVAKFPEVGYMQPVPGAASLFLRGRRKCRRPRKAGVLLSGGGGCVGAVGGLALAAGCADRHAAAFPRLKLVFASLLDAVEVVFRRHPHAGI